VRPFYALLLALAATGALAADASQRKFIKEEMSEGEVLLKIGKPDEEVVDTGEHAKHVVKRWIYFPDPNDPQTLTTITLRSGRVVFVEREITRD
jgi:hypothetical protein